MYLLRVWAVARGAEKKPPVQLLEQLMRAGDGDGALVQRLAEIPLEGDAVGLDPEGAEHRVPADLLQPRKRQLAALNSLPELVILADEDVVHPRFIRSQTEAREARAHGLTHVGIEVEERVVDIDKNGFHKSSVKEKGRRRTKQRRPRGSG